VELIRFPALQAGLKCFPTSRQGYASVSPTSRQGYASVSPPRSRVMRVFPHFEAGLCECFPTSKQGYASVSPLRGRVMRVFFHLEAGLCECFPHSEAGLCECFSTSRQGYASVSYLEVGLSTIASSSSSTRLSSASFATHRSTRRRQLSIMHRYKMRQPSLTHRSAFRFSFLMVKLLG